MQIRMLAFGLGTWIAFANMGMAQQTVKTPEAMYLQLDKAGFIPVSKVIFDSALPDVVRKPMKNYEDEMSGIKVKVSGANYSIDFANLTMEPRAGFLWANVKINEARVFADRIRLYKKVLGVPVSTTCRDTTIIVSGSQNLNLQVDFALSVENKQITVKPRKIDFKIREDQYRVSGPRTCSGELGIGSIIKSIVRDALERAREDIAKQVKQQVEKASKEIAEQLNEATHLQFDYHLDGMPPLPAVGFQLATWPQHIRLQSDSARFVFGVSSQLIPASKPIGKNRGSERSEESQDGWENGPQRVVMGSIGLNPDVLNEVFAQLTEVLPAQVLLDPGQVPGLAKILNIQSLSSVWPDLLQLKPDKDYLQIYLSLTEPPQIELTESKLGFFLRLPRFDLNFLASSQQQWFDYFHLNLGLENKLDMSIENGQFLLKYQQGTLTSLSGEWAETYIPQTNLVEWDIVESLTLTVFDYLYMQDELLRLDVPVIPLAGHQLRLENPYVEGSKFIAFKMMY